MHEEMRLIKDMDVNEFATWIRSIEHEYLFSDDALGHMFDYMQEHDNNTYYYIKEVCHKFIELTGTNIIWWWSDLLPPGATFLAVMDNIDMDIIADYLRQHKFVKKTSKGYLTTRK